MRVFIERDDRENAFSLEIAVDANGVMMPVADEDGDVQLQLQLFEQLE